MTELQHIPVGIRREFNQGVVEVTSTQEVIQLYNAAVKAILADVNRQPTATSRERINQLRKTLVPVNELARNLYNFVDDKILDARALWTDEPILLYLPRFMQALAVHRLIRSQLVGNHQARSTKTTWPGQYKTS